MKFLRVALNRETFFLSDWLALVTMSTSQIWLVEIERIEGIEGAEGEGTEVRATEGEGNWELGQIELRDVTMWLFVKKWLLINLIKFINLKLACKFNFEQNAILRPLTFI